MKSLTLEQEKGLFLRLREKNGAKLDIIAGVMWQTYLQVFRQVTVVDLYESLFSENTAGCPLAAGVIRLGTPLQEHKT